MSMDYSHLITWMLLAFIMSYVTPTPVVSTIWFAIGVWIFLAFMYFSNKEVKESKDHTEYLRKLTEEIKARREFDELTELSIEDLDLEEEE